MCRLPQEPLGKPGGASQSVTGGPPAMSIFFSFVSAKNATERLSGDQKGAAAPSVPASGTALESASGRTQRNGRPSAPRAANAIERPSGDTAKRFWLRIHANCVESGG